MTISGKDVSWKWVATGAIVIAGFFIAGWIGRVEAFGGDIAELQKSSVEQAAILSRVEKQVNDIHHFIFETEKDGG